MFRLLARTSLVFLTVLFRALDSVTSRISYLLASLAYVLRRLKTLRELLLLFRYIIFG